MFHNVHTIYPIFIYTDILFIQFQHQYIQSNDGYPSVTLCSVDLRGSNQSLQSEIDRLTSLLASSRSEQSALSASLSRLSLEHARYAEVSEARAGALEAEAAEGRRQRRRAEEGAAADVVATLSAFRASLDAVMADPVRRQRRWWAKGGEAAGAGDAGSVNPLLSSLAGRVAYLESELQEADAVLVQLRDSFGRATGVLRGTVAALEEEAGRLAAARAAAEAGEGAAREEARVLEVRCGRAEKSLLQLREVSSRLEAELAGAREDACAARMQYEEVCKAYGVTLVAE
jgi:peptidoglycan hydrolase CwlO-like protein